MNNVENMETKKRKLTPKQERFCEEYIVDLNATQAAIRTGYSQYSAKEIGYENLTKLHIQKKIRDLADKRSERTGITADSVLKEIARCAFLDPRKFFNKGGQLKDMIDLDPDVAAAARMDISVTKINEKIAKTAKIRFVDKKGALELLGKHLMLFTDRIETPETTMSHKFQIDTSNMSNRELEEFINERMQETRRINMGKSIGKG